MNTNDPGPLSTLAPPGAVADEIDPELLALPAPPRAQAIISAGIMAGVIGVSLILMWSFVGDVGYFLSARAPVDLGDGNAFGGEAPAVENRFVTVRGLPMAASAVRFRRFIRGGTYRVYPMMGQPRLFVQSFIADATRVGRRPRHGKYRGRLVAFADTRDGYGEVRALLERQTGRSVPDDAYLLMDGESPADYAWVIGLYTMLTLFAVTNGVLLYRHLRPIPME